MGVRIPFDNSFARLPEGFAARQAPEPVSNPRLVAFNVDLARIMGINPGETAEMAQVFAGNSVPEGAEPLAQLYAGHQFGHFNPQLGDGRAVLLGETVGTDGRRRDIQLKGSGRTPFSRMGDGRAWLGPVLREYVLSEAMAALGLPTTRALAAVETGDPVMREGPLPGAVLTRVAASHLRVGTFQIFAARKQTDHLRQLFDYAVARHYPQAEGPMGLLRAVRDAQVQLIAGWMSVGFIHGVMNTDNCQIAGETIDYGPCAFMDAYDDSRVFSSIDRRGRYAFANQPDIVLWNMAQLATALVPLMPDAEAAVTEFTEMMHAMRDGLRQQWRDVFAAKLGISEPRAGDEELAAELLGLMQTDGADFTNTFRALLKGSAQGELADRTAYQIWHDKWQARIAEEPDVEGTLKRANPAIIPRNHRIEQMIEAAVAGNFSLFHRMNAALATPYDDSVDDDLKTPPSPDEIVPATFCGT